jgi:site-specific recombinase XerD
MLRECWLFYHQTPSATSNTVTCLQRFLRDRHILPASAPLPSTPFNTVVDAYRNYLAEVRGLAPMTIQQHCWRATEFLEYSLQENEEFRLSNLTQAQIEKFITSVSPRFQRGTLQHVIAQIRGLLRFLAMIGEVPERLGSQIDTPRVYRLEQLPRAIGWDTVCAFLESIDRTDIRGLRDYAMFLMITTYGLRACDIASLHLADINWRGSEVHIKQTKTGHPHKLPLTDSVAEALLKYLRDGRPTSHHREVFLTLRAPTRPISRIGVGSVYRSRVGSSGLEIPFQGLHCLRHSYAVNLLRQGESLKSIGDILGHRSTESTCVYLRLNLDDLREVGLSLPAASTEVSP